MSHGHEQAAAPPSRQKARGSKPHKRAGRATAKPRNGEREDRVTDRNRSSRDDDDYGRSSCHQPQQLRVPRWALKLAIVVGLLGAIAYHLWDDRQQRQQRRSYITPPASPEDTATAIITGGETSVPPGATSALDAARAAAAAAVANQAGPDKGREKRPVGSLRPEDIPGPAVFGGFDEAVGDLVVTVADGDVESSSSKPEESENASTATKTQAIRYRKGKVLQINRFETSSLDKPSPPVFSTVTLFPGLVPRSTVQKMLELLRRHASELDVDPDTVDGMPTYEVFVDSVEIRRNQPTLKTLDSGYPNNGAQSLDGEPSQPRMPQPQQHSHGEYDRRRRLRARLQELTGPAVETITQAVRARHPDLCNATGASTAIRGRRLCTPCYSLIRRYRWGERTSHPPHYDGHARVTVVVSLSDYGEEYTGGLYVSTGHGPQREFLNLSRGDAVLHPSTLLHGVHVYPSSRRPARDTERWSWILWFRDSEECVDHSMDWFAECAAQGNPLCLQFQASKLVQHYEATASAASGAGNKEEESRVGRRVMELNMMAAEKGAAEAAVKVARAYLKQLPSDLEFNLDEAKRFFRLAIRSHSSEGHFGMASVLVAESNMAASPRQQDEALRRAVYHLERAATSLHAYGCFNLGVAHIFGYGVPRVDMELGVQWLVRSGLPEGFVLASQYAATIGDQSRHDEWLRQALILGWDQPWRVQARQSTGSGGAAGVDLNLMWPPSIARGGIQPPRL